MRKSRSHCVAGEQARPSRGNLAANARLSDFQTRYRSLAELQSLPYAAYHPVWVRQSLPVSDNLGMDEDSVSIKASDQRKELPHPASSEADMSPLDVAVIYGYAGHATRSGARVALTYIVNYGHHSHPKCYPRPYHGKMLHSAKLSLSQCGHVLVVHPGLGIEPSRARRLYNSIAQMDRDSNCLYTCAFQRYEKDPRGGVWLTTRDGDSGCYMLGI